MAEPFLALHAGLDPSLLSLVLLTLALILLWFKRRTLAHTLPSVAVDFLTRHVETVRNKYPYNG